MKVIIYKCTLCDNSWEEDNVFGVHVEEDSMVKLVEPDDTEKHICVHCMRAIQDQFNTDKVNPVVDEESGRGMT